MNETPSDALPRLWSAETRPGEAPRGRRGLVVGIANARSIAYGCAAALRACGAELAITRLNEKAEPHARPLAERRAPQQRLVDIAEVGRVVAFLVSGAASGMTGEVIHVDGGLRIRA